MGKAPSLKVGDQLAGRFFNAYGGPIDGGAGPGAPPRARSPPPMKMQPGS